MLDFCKTPKILRQIETNGKVTPDILISADRRLKRHGFTKEQIGVYLMYGLPNIDPLLTNYTVFACLYSGYDLIALERLKLDVMQYNSS